MIIVIFSKSAQIKSRGRRDLGMYLTTWVISVLAGLCIGHKIRLIGESINGDSCDIEVCHGEVTIKAAGLARARLRVDQSSNKLEFKTENSSIMLISDDEAVRGVDSTLRNNDRILIIIGLGEEDDDLVSSLPKALEGYVESLETINQRLLYLEVPTVAVLQFSLNLTDDGNRDPRRGNLINTPIMGHNLHRVHHTECERQINFMPRQPREPAVQANLRFSDPDGLVVSVHGGAIVNRMPGKVFFDTDDGRFYQYVLVIPLESSVIDGQFLQTIKEGFGTVTAGAFLYVVSQLNNANDHAVILVP